MNQHPVTRPRDALRNELHAFTPSAHEHYGVWFRWVPPDGVTGEHHWQLLATTPQHDLADALAELYGAITHGAWRVDTLIMVI